MAMHFAYINGQRQLITSMMSATNDLGEFRLFGLAPGQYFVQATRRGNQFGMSRDPQGYPPVYYPGVADASRAAPISVRGGDEFSGVDISLRPTHAVTVKGRALNAGCGESLQGLMVMMQSASSNAAPMNALFARTDQGSFELRSVLPGAYYLTAMLRDEGKQCIGRQPLEVGDADIDGVTVVVSPGVEIKGRLRSDGQADSLVPALTVSLASKIGGATFGASRDSVKSDGGFVLKNVYDGDYEINVSNLPDNYFVKSARLDGVDVLAAGVTIDTKQAPGSLDIVISANGASVDGAITKDQQPFQGATVAIVPDPPHRGERRLFKSTTTDQNGHFTLQGLAPGDYKVFAWEKIESGAYTSPEFLQPYENLGESVHLTEGSRNSVQVDLVPSKDANQ